MESSSCQIPSQSTSHGVGEFEIRKVSSVARTLALLNREAPGIFVALLYSLWTDFSLHKLYNNSSQYYFYSTSITQITPYFIVCCKHVYDCNSTKARWFQPEIRIGFAKKHLQERKTQLF